MTPIVARLSGRLARRGSTSVLTRWRTRRAASAVALGRAEEKQLRQRAQRLYRSGNRLAAIRRRLIRFHLQDARKAAAMTRLQDEIAVLVQDSVAPDVSASGLNA
jgi:hypothetical protein